MDYKLLISKAIELGFTDVEVYISNSSSLTIGMFNGNLDKNNMNTITDISIRAIYNEKMAYMYVEDEDLSIDYILEKLKNNALCLNTNEKFSIYAGDKEYPNVEKKLCDYNVVPTYKKIELLKKLTNKIQEIDSKVTMVDSKYVEEVEKIHIINSKGLDLKKSNGICGVVCEVVVKQNEETKDDYEIEVKNDYNDLNLDKLCDKVVKTAISKFNSKIVKTAKYPVVIDNDTMVSLLSTYFGNFSGESAIQKVTPLLGKENTMIYSPLVTIVDDPLKNDALYTHPFDDEGVACFTKNVVKEGMLITLLHNLKTAKYFNTVSTGNGFKAGSSISVKPANFYIEPGKQSKDELVQSLEEGLLITGLDGLHAGANPISGDFSLKASGFFVQNGKIIHPVSLIVVAGNFTKLMNDIDSIGSDLKIGLSGIGSPSIKFNGLAVSGM